MIESLSEIQRALNTLQLELKRAKQQGYADKIPDLERKVVLADGAAEHSVVLMNGLTELRGNV